MAVKQSQTDTGADAVVKCLSLAIIGLGFCLQPSLGHAQTTASGINQPATQIGATSYDDAVTYLKRGRKFQVAINILLPLCKEHPENVDYNIALGCACASRYASLAQACKLNHEYESAVARQVELQKKWEKAQNDPDDPLYLTRPPIAPTQPVAPDDYLPLRLNNAQLAAQFRLLNQQTHDAFEQARKSARTDSANCEVAYNEGWALLLMRRYEPVIESVNKELTSDAVVKLPTQDEAITCFLTCTDKDKEQAQNWQSLALAYGSSYLRATGVTAPSKEDSTKAIESLQKAVELKPKDFDVLYEAAVFSRNSNPNLSVQMLERAARRLGINAALWYMLADQRLTASTPDTQAAIQAVQQGNNAHQYDSISLTIPCPAFLKQAWGYQKSYAAGYDFAVLGSLASSLSKLIDQFIANGQQQEARTAITALFGTGLQMSRNVQLDLLDSQDPLKRAEQNLRMGFGTGVCHRAVELAQKALKLKPDDELQQFISEAKSTFDYLKEREDKFRN